jgi:hypothetical protein
VCLAKAAGQVRPRVQVVEIPPPSPNGSPEPGPVESAVEAEISGLAQAELRPALAAIAAAMARVLDSTPPTPKPSAAKVLVSVLDTLHKGSAQVRRGNLAVVRAMASSRPPDSARREVVRAAAGHGGARQT